MKTWTRVAATACLTLAVALVVATIGAAAVLHDPPRTVWTIARYILLSAGMSLLVGTAGITLGMRYLPRLSLKVGLGYGIASLGAIVTVLYTPLLMFKETQDLHMLVLMLVSFLVISLGLAAIIGMLVAQHLQALREASQRVAAGEFETRVAVPSGDELSELANAFNRMSVEIGRAFERERAMDRARRDLIASISHDLRTPLAAMRAMVEAIQDRVVDDERTIAEYHRRIHHEIDRLSRLIDDLFELSRLESGSMNLERSKVDLPALLRESVDSLSPTAQRRGVTLGLSIGDGVGQVCVDSRQIQRVVLNLVQNALRHTPEGGTVSVLAGRDDGDLRIEVVDTGEGIAADDLPHIFDRFYRGEKSRARHEMEAGTSGAGLGLAIAKAIVEAHGGDISAESRGGLRESGADETYHAGARFIVSLPVTPTLAAVS